LLLASAVCMLYRLEGATGVHMCLFQGVHHPRFASSPTIDEIPPWKWVMTDVFFRY